MPPASKPRSRGQRRWRRTTRCGSLANTRGEVSAPWASVRGRTGVESPSRSIAQCGLRDACSWACSRQRARSSSSVPSVKQRWSAPGASPRRQPNRQPLRRRPSHLSLCSGAHRRRRGAHLRACGGAPPLGRPVAGRKWKPDKSGILPSGEFGATPYSELARIDDVGQKLSIWMGAELTPFLVVPSASPNAVFQAVSRRLRDSAPAGRRPRNRQAGSAGSSSRRSPDSRPRSSRSVRWSSSRSRRPPPSSAAPARRLRLTAIRVPTD